MELQKVDLIWCLRRLPKKIFNLMKKDGPQLVLAGGFIRSCITNEPIHDIDLFCSTPNSAKMYSLQLSGGGRVIETDNAYTVLVPQLPAIQLIHRWVYERPEDIIPSFDFTIARAAIWYNRYSDKMGKWRSNCDDRYYPDLAAKRLTYCSPIRNEDAGGSILRVLKFYQCGYRIPLDSLGAVISRLVMGIEHDAVAIKSPDNEEWISKILTGLLREVDPNVDPTHSAHMPSDREHIEENQNDQNTQ